MSEPDLSLAEWIRSPQVSATALLSEVEQRTNQKSDLNAYITLASEQAHARAETSDKNLAQKKGRRLEGAPIGVKDNFCTNGILTTAGSNILRNFVPTYESAVTERLLGAGAIVVGKTNMDEFGMGSSTETSAFGATVNPTALKRGVANRTPGGSSGGSAAAVAADLCLAALGTDTGGSIRQPASFCGVVGFKPTYGLCSRWGIISYGSSLDQAGVITKTVEDAALLMSVIAGPDERDSTSIRNHTVDFDSELARDYRGAVVAIPRELREQSGDANLERLWSDIEKRIADAGCSTTYVSLPTLKSSLAAYYIIALCEASSNLARYDGVRYGSASPEASSIVDLYEQTRAAGFGAEVQRRVLLGTFALSSGYYEQYYLRAARVRAKLCAEIEAVFKDAEFMVWPTAPTAAFELGRHSADPIAMYLEDAFTVPVNLAGLPAISIPGTTSSENLPMGFQVIGRRLGDAGVLGLAHHLSTRA